MQELLTAYKDATKYYNDAINGSYPKKPYNLKNFGLSEISIHLDSNT